MLNPTCRFCLHVVVFTLLLAGARPPQAQAAVTPVSHWRLGENDAGAIGGSACSSVVDLVGGRTLQFAPSVFWDIGVSATAAARVGSTFCLRAYGTESAGTNAAIPSLTNNFGLELWVNPSTLTGNQCLAYNGNSGSSGWGLYLIGDQYRVLFGGVGFVGTATATVGTWAHLALVRDNGVTTLYVNGVASGTTSAATPNPPAGRVAVLGQPQNPAAERLFGFLDEVRVFTFAPGSFSTNDLLLARGWVYSTADSGNGSLRSAITNLNATGAGTINFAVAGTISLQSSLPAIANSIVINGPGTNLLTVSGNGSNRLFQLAASSTNFISGLTLASGFTSNNNSGAAIYNLGNTVLQSCALVSNTVVGGFGGAVANFGAGSLRVTNCTFAYNTCRGGNGVSAGSSRGGSGGGGSGMGGAIYTEGAALTLSGSAFQANQAVGGNGGSSTTREGANNTGGSGGFPNPGAGGTLSSAAASGGFGGGGGGGDASDAGAPGGFGGGGGGGGYVDNVGGGGGNFGGNGGAGIFTPNITAGGGGGGAGLGGAIFARAGTVALANCALTGNMATNGVGGSGGNAGGNGQGVGGAIFVLNAALNLAGNTFSGNTASTTQPILGGSTIVVNTNDSGAGSLRQAVLIANNAGSTSTITFAPALSGQTITLTSGQLTLASTVTIDGSALPSGIRLNGNASSRIFEVLSGSTVVLDSLTLTNGQASGGSGGGILNAGNLTVNRCTLVGNKADLYGGGIENNGSQSLVVNQSTLTANQCFASGGAALDISVGPVTVQHCTVSGNVATTLGGTGGVANYSSGVTINNSIVAGNSAPIAVNLSGNSITFTGSNLTNGTPLLAPLGNYGGRTQSMPPLPGSPAIDGCTAGTSFGTDQRGKPRIVGAFADIGAVEGAFDPNYPIVNFTRLGTGNVGFNFTNLSGPSYRVLASTNVAAPINTWSNLGAPTEAPAGTFTFTDLQATNYPQRFYRVTTP